MKQSRSGHLLKEILDRFTDKTMSTLTPDRSLWMYFGHDCTLADMLNSLGVFDVCFARVFLLLKSIFRIIFYHFSYVFLRTHRAFCLSYTKDVPTPHMFKFSTKTQSIRTFHRWTFQIVAPNVHYTNCMICTRIYCRLRASMMRVPCVTVNRCHRVAIRKIIGLITIDNMVDIKAKLKKIDRCWKNKRI